MARTQVVDSATAQFFINLKDNDFLNHSDETARGFGYVHSPALRLDWAIELGNNDRAFGFAGCFESR